MSSEYESLGGLIMLDVTKVQSIAEDQQQIYILSFLRDLEKLVSNLDEDGCSSHQLYVQKELLKVLKLSNPPPSKVTRNLIGRIFAQIFTKGDRKLLFDTINELTNIINVGKAEKDLRGRHAAVHVLGAVYEAAGDSAMQLGTLSATSLMKLIKLSGNHTGLRAAIFRSLGKIYGMLGSSGDENVIKDAWKQARSFATSDKAGLVQVAALQCMETLAKSTPYFLAQSDFEKMLNVVLKTLDSPIGVVRKAAASCLASALELAHSTDPALIAAKSPKRSNTKKNKTKSIANLEDDIPERPSSPVPGPKKSAAFQLTFDDILRQLSVIYTKSSISQRVRAGLVLSYEDLLTRLDPTIIEENYLTIANHFFNDLLSHQNITSNRFRLLSSRKYVKILLEDVIGTRLLGETGQLNAVKKLVEDIIKKYPSGGKETPEPTKYTLTAALHALASLVKALGSMTATHQDLIRDGLLQVVQHPSYGVQVAASYCLKVFVLACPSQLLSILTILMNNVNRELNQLAGKRTTEMLRRCIGFANGLAATLSTAPLQPLYASVDVTSRILTLATSLLKSSGDLSDLRVSSTQIQVAWILLGGLMSLGPNFVKIHLSQLLLLWKGALPKPLAKDSVVERGLLELSFLAHVRDCALGSILAFLEFNSKLVTMDVSKRIASMLQNSALFLNTLPNKKTSDDVAQRLSPSLQLVDYDLMVRRRVLQCYVKLVKLNHGANLEANLLTQAVSFFADPEKYTPSSLSTAIASSAGAFESLWEIGDGYGYGVCDFVRCYDITSFGFESSEQGGGRGDIIHWLTNHEPADEIEQTLNTPVIGALEHDSVTLYLMETSESAQDLRQAPPATAVVNSAIDLFTVLLPMQQPKVQESILEQIATFLASNTLQRNPGRKAAMTVNIAVALFGTLKNVTSSPSSAGNLTTPSVLKIIQEILQSFVIHPDPFVRNVAYEAIGRLCSIGGNTFTGSVINTLIDNIVNNRDPNARAGCAVALGCIHRDVGGMAATSHLKTILGILMSLCSDPHPTVHFWAFEGLQKTIDSAGLTFSGYVTHVLGMLAQLYGGETHDDEIAGSQSSNLELELATTNVIVRCMDSLVSVMGPDLQEMTKPRELILTLTNLCLLEPDYTIVRESISCLEHISMFAGGFVDWNDYIGLIQKTLQSSHWELRDTAINGLYQQMRGDAVRVLKHAGPTLEDDIWLALNTSPKHEGLRNIISNWLSQTAVSDFSKWVERIQTIMTKSIERKKPESSKSAAAAAAAAAAGDDEEASFAASTVTKGEKTAEGAAGAGKQELLKWQVRTFAMACLGELLDAIGPAIKDDPSGQIEEKAIGKISDVIRMAFSASTASVVELRLRGLRIVDQVLKLFGQMPDPDFPEAPLLEQYQAQIGSALTPAFAADSSPELAAAAVNVCAAFISTGIVQDVERMGRILKLLVSALQSFASDSETSSIGELKGLSSNAQVMVKMAVLAGWAELQVASVEQKYLESAVKPQVRILAPLWLNSLRDFAQLRFEPDVASTVGPTPSLGGSMDSIYSSLNRDTLLKFYQASWLNIVDAVACLIEQGSDHIFDALDGRSPSGSNGQTSAQRLQNDEPVTFFFVLFGLAFEALVGRSGGESLASKEQTLDVLLALKKILHPAVCGKAIFQDAVFSETVDLLDRLVLTEGLPVQKAIVEIVRTLCSAHPSVKSPKLSDDEKQHEDVDQLFELTRLIVLVLTNLLPNLGETKKTMRHELNEEAVDLIRVSLDALVDAAEVFPAVIKTDLYACIFHIFITLFGTGVCQAEVLPRSLPIFKRFLSILTKSMRGKASEEITGQIRACLGSVLNYMDNAQLRGEAGVPTFRNTLMGATIVITGGVNVLSPKDDMLERLCDSILVGLEDSDVSKTAASCARSLILHTPKSAADQEIVRYLLPKLIEYVSSDKNNSSEHTQAAKAIIVQTFTQYIPTLFGDQVPLAISLFVPTLLARASHVRTRPVYVETSNRLIELATASQQAFKLVVSGLTPNQRAFLEEVLRTGAVGGQQAAQSQTTAAPTIALKMTF